MFHLIFRVNKDWHSSKQFLSDSLFRTIDSFFLSVSGVWLKTQSPVVRLKFVESCRNCKQVKKAVENGLVEVVVVWARSQPPFWPLQKQWKPLPPTHWSQVPWKPGTGTSPRFYWSNIMASTDAWIHLTSQRSTCGPVTWNLGGIIH